MAHKKGAGSSRNGRESHSKRLGIKIFGGQAAISGNIIVRQRGTKHHPDKGVGIGKDHTLFALVDGTVIFKKKQDNKSYVSILPAAVVKEVVAEKAPAKKTVKAEAPVVEASVVEAPVAEAPAKEEKAPKKAVKAEAAETESTEEAASAE